MRCLQCLLRYSVTIAVIGLASVALGQIAGNRSDSSSLNKQETNPASIDLICTPAKPLVLSGETIMVTAWSDRIGDAPETFSWEPSDGLIEGDGRHALWSFEGVDEGIYHAMARKDSGSNSGASCTVTVIVQQQDRDRVGRDLLISGEPEAAGYGAYSYILMRPMPGADSHRERFRKVIEAYLSTICSIADLRKYIVTQQLNIVYLPVRPATRETEISDCGEEQLSLTIMANRILQRYDYARASYIFNVFGIDLRGPGPFIITSLQSASELGGTSASYIVQNFSYIPKNAYDIIPLWMTDFFNLAAQERDWSRPTAGFLTYKIRVVFAVAASGFPDITKAVVDNWVFLKLFGAAFNVGHDRLINFATNSPSRSASFYRVGQYRQVKVLMNGNSANTCCYIVADLY